MERFSRFRDAGTGIQVFLPPVPPAGSDSSASTVLLLPLTVVFGAIRIALVLVFGLLWVIGTPLVSPLGRRGSTVANKVFGRLVLGSIGIPYIHQEVVSVRNRGRPSHTVLTAKTAFRPQKGDIILCNWSSWIDVLYLVARFNPVFIRPVVEASNSTSPSASASQNQSSSRRKNAVLRGQQHADISSTRSPSSSDGGPAAVRAGEERIHGWRRASWLEMVLRAGRSPEARTSKEDVKTFDRLIKEIDAPIVVFPELVTSNNRGILRFESIFPSSWRALYRATGALRIGKGQSNVFIMSIKHDAPTSTSPSTTLSVPSAHLSPVPHLLRLCLTPALLRPCSLSVRLLPADESPTHASFAADAQAGNSQRKDPLGDKCADLMSSLCVLRCA